MRRAAQRDGNEPEIVAGLRHIGCSVAMISKKGFPDLVLGWRNRTFLAEVKDPNAMRGNLSKTELSQDQQNFYDNWEGQYDVVETIEEACAVIGVGPRTVARAQRGVKLWRERQRKERG